MGVRSGRGIYARDFTLLYRYHELPAIYHKDRVRGFQQAVRAGETREEANTRQLTEFAAMQASPFFDLWASAAIDEILSGLYERLIAPDA